MGQSSYEFFICSTFVGYMFFGDANVRISSSFKAKFALFVCFSLIFVRTSHCFVQIRIYTILVNGDESMTHIAFARNMNQNENLWHNWKPEKFNLLYEIIKYLKKMSVKIIWRKVVKNLLLSILTLTLNYVQ